MTMDEILIRMGVLPITIPRAAVTAKQLGRGQVADRLGVHPDSVTKRLSAGLASAVLKWGGANKEMRFSAALVARWQHATNCRNGENGRPCRTCWLALEDAKAVAEHLIEKRHGVLEACGENCNGYPDGVCGSCRCRY